MESREYTQFGTLTVAVMVTLILVFTGLLVDTGLTYNSEMYIYASFILIFLICLLMFYRLVITVDNNHISFKLGIGIIHKSYKISEISSCKPVENQFIDGWGIRKIEAGWLYNVSGLKAIELRFKDSRKVVRIGTNQPDEVAETMAKLIAVNHQSEQSISTPENKSKTRNTIIFVALTGIIIGSFIYYESRAITVNIKETQFEITGDYGFSQNYSDIVSIDTISQMPNIEWKTDGFATKKVRKGNFILTGVGSARLFINFNVSPFVRLVPKSGQVIYFNLKDRPSTIEVFDKLKAKMK